MYTRNCIGHLAVVLALAAATPAMAAVNRTVNKPGGGTNDYSTITAALAAAGDNDVITVYDRPGANPAYVLWDTGSEGNDRLEIANLDGVTLEGYDYGPNPTDKVVIDGNRSSANEPVGINVLGSSDNITIKNFWIEDCDEWAIKTNSPGEGHIIDDVYFDDNYHIALQISSDDNIVKNCVFNRTLEDTSFSPSGDGCRVVLADGCEIRDCLSSDNTNDGYRLDRDTNTKMIDRE